MTVSVTQRASQLPQPGAASARTYSEVKLVRLPSEAGMVPLRLLVLSSLRGGAKSQSADAARHENK